MKQNIEQLARELLLLAEKKGVDAAEVFVQESNGLEFELRDQEIEKLRNARTIGFGLRVMHEGRLGFIQSSDISEKAMEEGVEKAYAIARITNPDQSNTFSRPAEYPSIGSLYDYDIANIGFETKTRMLADIESLCFAYDPAITKIEDARYSEFSNHIVIANTHGLFASRASTNFNIALGVIAERDGEVESGSARTSACFFKDLEPPSKLVGRACSKAVSLLGCRRIGSMVAPVIFDKQAVYALLNHLLAMVNGQNIADGTSMLDGWLGEKIGSDLVTVVDDATLEHRIGSREFDDEGTRSQRNVVIEKGILNCYLFDNRSARRTGRVSTGNASRQTYAELPRVDSTNFFIEAGEEDPEDIIRSTEKGIFVVDLKGWWVGINPSTGDFSSGAKGYFIEKGEIIHPVRNLTLASKIPEILKAIDAVGNDFEFYGEMGSPTIRISEMHIGA
ncbi:MAG: TldD/PmbA family protein [bacterium]